MKEINERKIAESINDAVLGILVINDVVPGEKAAKLLGKTMAAMMLGLDGGIYTIHFLESFNCMVQQIMEHNKEEFQQLNKTER